MSESTLELLKVSEAQEVLRVSKNTVLKFIHEKKIPAKKIGRNYMIDRKDVIEFIEKCSV